MQANHNLISYFIIIRGRKTGYYLRIPLNEDRECWNEKDWDNPFLAVFVKEPGFK